MADCGRALWGPGLGSLAAEVSKGGAYVEGARQKCGWGEKVRMGTAGQPRGAPTVGEGGHGARVMGLAGPCSPVSSARMLSGGMN